MAGGGTGAATSPPGPTGAGATGPSAGRRPAGRAAATGGWPDLRLVVPDRPVGTAPVLDADQEAVAEHRDGPALVLAGPGTGKTTTLVEAVARRIERDGIAPERILVLTFSRAAASELRTRITVRLGRPTAVPLAWTFHSYCHALLRRWDADDSGGAPGPGVRLLTGPEQDAVVREMLAGDADDAAAAAAGAGGRSGRRWPATLHPALRTRGFAEEVRNWVARAREAGLEPVDAAAAAALPGGRPAWRDAAGFLDAYLSVLDALQAVDYTELVRRAATRAERPRERQDLRQRYDAVYVDEYQDTDTAQDALLQALAGDGSPLVVVGDPDQAIYAFRGARVTNLLAFPDRFPTAAGGPAPVLTLRTSRRSSAELLAASRAVARRLPVPLLPVATVRRHRALLAAPRPAPPVAGPAVAVWHYPSAVAEADGIAELLRRAHLHQGLPWSQMAVLVRSGSVALPLLTRVLSAGGVPVQVAGDELPLAEQPAVQTLLQGLTAAADVTALSDGDAADLLLSPLGGADPGQLRQLGRRLRRGCDRPSADLLGAAVRDGLTGPVATDNAGGRSAQALHQLLRRAATALGDGGVEGALWVLWDGSGWPDRLRRSALSGGPDAAVAHAALDAVVALFDLVRDAVRSRPGRGVGAVVAALRTQQIPAAPAEQRGVAGAGAVALMTAHRSKGLEFDLVVVAGVQDGRWPDLRVRGSLLDPDALPRQPGGPTSPAPSRADLEADERRLFYVAVTRARRQLVATAVASPDDDGETPSPLLDSLGVAPVVQSGARVPRPLTLLDVTAELRRVAEDPAASAALVAAATDRLAWLAGSTDDDGRPLAPWAHPDRWWGTRPAGPQRPPVDPGEPVSVSPSEVEQALRCPLAWFLERRAGGGAPSSVKQLTGTLIHALAERVATGSPPASDQAATTQFVDELHADLSDVWAHLPWPAEWLATRELAAARGTIAAVVAYHQGSVAAGDEVIGVEVSMGGEVPTPAGPVRLRGRLDRLERTPDGDARVVDFKTASTAVSLADGQGSVQLALYQLAVALGLLSGAADGLSPGGGRLVFPAAATAAGRCREQTPLDAADRARTLAQLGQARSVLAGPTLLATVHDDCRRCAFRGQCPAQDGATSVLS